MKSSDGAGDSAAHPVRDQEDWARASVLIESEPMLQILVLTRFLHPNGVHPASSPGQASLENAPGKSRAMAPARASPKEQP